LNNQPASSGGNTNTIPFKKQRKCFKVWIKEREREIQKLGIKIKEKSKPFTSIFVKKRNA